MSLNNTKYKIELIPPNKLILYILKKLKTVYNILHYLKLWRLKLFEQEG